MISIAAPNIGPEETEAVMAVLKSGALAQGPKVAALEAAFADYCGTKHAVAVNSGTAAIHCALNAIGVGPGDEVIAPPFTFMATVSPVLMQGATIKFADIAAADFNLDPAKVEEAISAKTKAIIAVDLYGQPCDYDALAAIARKHNLRLVEDACQAIGAEYGQHRAGAFGEVATFSLYATKNIMSGEGGVLTTDDAEIAQSAKRFRQHGMSASYEYSELGYNYRLTDILAAIALEQLKKVEKFTALRRRNAAIYDAELKGLTGITTPLLAADRSHVYHQYTIRVTDEFPLSRDDLAAKLRQNDIVAGVYYPKPLHHYQHITGSKGDFPEAELAAKQVLSLPVHPLVTEADARKVATIIKEAVNG